MTRAVRILSALLSVLLLVSLAAAAEDQFFDADGVRIRYVIEGEGEPVLLIHGFTVSVELQWYQPGIFAELAKQYRVIALDNRGHGKSDKPHDPDAYGLEMVKDIVRLMDHLEIRQAHVVGYSMGGFITNKLLATHPERVLTATLGGAGWSRAGDWTYQLLDELAESLEKNRSIAPLIVALTPEGRPKPSEEQIRFFNQTILALNDPDALAAVARSLKQLVVEERALRANQVPTLALIGEVDPLKESVDAMRGVMSNLEIVVIEEADHMTAPGNRKFIDSLSEFLATYRAESNQKAEPAAAPN